MAKQRNYHFAANRRLAERKSIGGILAKRQSATKKQSRQRKYIDGISHFGSFPINNRSIERKNVGGNFHFSCLAVKWLNKNTFSIEGFL